jgi:hypothetical protein
MCADVLHITNKRQARRPVALPRNQSTSGKLKAFPATASQLDCQIVVHGPRVVLHFMGRVRPAWPRESRALGACIAGGARIELRSVVRAQS